MDHEPSVSFASLFEKSLNAISVHTLIVEDGVPVDYRFDAVNPAFEAMTGLKAVDVVGKTVKAVLPGTEATWIERYGRVALTGEPEAFESYSQALGKWFSVSAFQHKPMGFTVAFFDTTRQQQDHQAALERESMYRSFFDVGNAVKLVIDPVTREILEANPRAAEFYGYSREDLRRMKVEQINIREPAEIDDAMGQARLGTLTFFEMRHRLRTGEIRDVEVYAAPGQWLGREALFSIVHDVTDWHQLQKRMLQRERLSAVGEMTASLYHEFGNLLAVIFAQVQLLENEVKDGPAKSGLHSRLQKQFQRAERLVTSVKRFSRDQAIELMEISLTTLIEDLVELERPLCQQAGISVEWQPAADGLIRADSALIQQVFLNLFKNAVQALERTRDPSIHLEVRDEGPEVVVRFSNNGPDIPPEVRPQLFTPFFTTRREADDPGTGLGLSFSWTIVHNHGGTLFLEDGPGTVFQIRLPRALPVA